MMTMLNQILLNIITMSTKKSLYKYIPEKDMYTYNESFYNKCGQLGSPW